MTKAFLALGAAAFALSAVPAESHGRHVKTRVCTKIRHGVCVASHKVTRHARRGSSSYRVGHVFGPRYGYTAYTALPSPYVTRYRLRPDYRYVYTGNTVYVVDPTTYAITRILNGVR